MHLPEIGVQSIYFLSYRAIRNIAQLNTTAEPANRTKQ
jgi:hypothetical protein